MGKDELNQMDECLYHKINTGLAEYSLIHIREKVWWLDDARNICKIPLFSPNFFLSYLA